ncbi:polysaccharide export outer membrane protein [Flavobacterium gillisiae]|uniref:Polysaccharide export outer membrane protein n=1 Tax=Flavobacterium gillisiae TaxID=150146 RepID=A0A1H3ZSE4_9FLAO|nr:polysaccharide biosynthesis/export family protein [Flavobacterium gillisiae]SEA26321.1 polysaccharide export outer membrane protein [Flavobacterium gillisiae]
MIAKPMSKSILLLIVFIVSTSFFSCTTKKDLLYFQNPDKSNFSETVLIDKKINIDDILSVKIYSLDIESSAPYNFTNNNNNTGTSTEILKLQSYLVDNSGKITLPVLAGMKVTDKSTEELELFLTNKLKNEGHLKNPIVVVRVLNSKITILGEVKLPGTYNFTEKNLTVLQAIGLAGDLTINGQRNDVMLIRHEENTKKIIHLDLTSTDLLNSPYYYISQNDVIVVNPNKAKVKSAGIIGNAGTLLSVFTLLLTTIVLILK